MVLAGSLPPGAPADWYAALVGDLRSLDVGVAVDTSGPPLDAIFAHLDQAAPDLLKPNAEELASVVGGDPEAIEADPVAGGTGRLRARRARSRRGAGHPRRLRRRPGHRARAPGARRHRPPRSSAPSGPATPASSATSSERCGAADPPSGCGSPSPTAAPPPGCPAPPSPPPRRSTPSSSTSPSSPSPDLNQGVPMNTSPPIITEDLVRLDVSLGEDKNAVIRALAQVVADAGRTDIARRSQRGRARPRGDLVDRTARRHRDPALPHRARRDAHLGLRPPQAGHRLRCQGRPGRPGVPDRGAGRR